LSGLAYATDRRRGLHLWFWLRLVFFLLAATNDHAPTRRAGTFFGPRLVVTGLREVPLDSLDLLGRDGAHMIAYVAHTERLKQGHQGLVF
jgi:hypothetical protein